MKLHQHPYSSSSFKVRAIIRELELPVQLHDIDFGKAEHKSPEFLAKSPFGRIPMLEEDGFCLAESNAICEYLASKAPERNLVPSDAKGRGAMHQWLHWQSSALGSAVHKIMWETFYAHAFGRAPDQANLAKGREETAKELEVLERGLRGKEYVCGKLSIADFAIACTLLLHAKIGIDLAPFPAVKAFMERMEARPSVKGCLPPMG